MSHDRLILVGVNRLFREGLKHVLSNDTVKIVGECTSLLETHALLRSIPRGANLIVYDLNEETPIDLALMKEIRQEFPQVSIVILADNANSVGLDMAISGGARGFLPKSISSGALSLALKLILLGENLFAGPASLSRQRSAPIRAELHEIPVLRLPLSTREGEILRCLERGAPNKVIARQLDMAEATVKVHIKAVLRKINVDNRTQAAVWAMKDREAKLNANLNASPD